VVIKEPKTIFTTETRRPRTPWDVKLGHHVVLPKHLELLLCVLEGKEPIDIQAFKLIDFPGATLTRALGTNTNGDIVGTYVAGNVQHAFVRSAKGRGNQ